MVMVVSDGLRSTHIWSKFNKGACPQTLLECCALYIHKEKILRAARAVCPHQPHSVCAPPLLQPLDPPLQGVSTSTAKMFKHYVQAHPPTFRFNVAAQIIHEVISHTQTSKSEWKPGK